MALTKINNNTLSAITGLPAGVGGKVLQVVSTTKTDTFSTTSSSKVDITGLSVAITPSSTSNKILIFCSIYFGRGNQNSGFVSYLLRDSTEIGSGASSGSRQNGIATLESAIDTYTMNSSSFNFLDSPSSTSAITYKIQTKSRDSSEISINMSSADPNEVYGQRVSSTITAYEIAG